MAGRPGRQIGPKPSTLRSDSEINCFIKYLVFGFNITFWLLGLGLLAIGIWAWTEKEVWAKLEKLSVSDWSFDPVIPVLIIGAIMFVIGFFGCIGALRENTALLLIYCIAVGLILLLQLVLGIIVFVFKEKLADEIQKGLKRAIEQYRDDADLQNMIDWIQREGLQCCGINKPEDWEFNLYFNCSSPSIEKCGVPFSCCIRSPEDLVPNSQCGYGMLLEENFPDRSEKIHTKGCYEAGEEWLKKNLVPVAAVAVAIALLESLGICFAQNLRSDVLAQRRKWIYNHPHSKMRLYRGDNERDSRGQHTNDVNM